MRFLSTPVATTGRWAVAVGIVVFLVVLSQAALGQSGRERDLGLSAEARDGRLVVVRVQPAGWAWDAGIRPQDTILSIDGRPLQPNEDGAAVRSAQRVEVRSPTGIVRLAPAGPPPVPSTPLHQASFSLLAFALVAIGVTVFIVARDLGTAGSLLALSVSGATVFEASLGQPSGAAWTLVSTAIALIGFGGSTIILFLLFPVNWADSPWGRTALAGAILLHAFLVAWYLWVVAADTAAFEILQKIVLGVVVVDLLGAIGLLAAGLTRPQSREASWQGLQLVAIGAIVGFAPFALLSLAPFAMGFGYLVQPDITILSLVLFPASIGAALLSRQFMGATRLLRRGMIAMGVWVALLAVYSLLWYLADRALTEIDPAGVLDAAVVAVAAIAATFPFAQHWLRRSIERWLFHDVYDYAPTLRAISEELVYIARVEPIARHVLGRLGTTLDLSWAAIVLEGRGERREYSWGEAVRPHPGRERAERPPLPEGDGVGFRRIPLVVEAKTIGELQVGPKRHDVELLPEDLSLLNTVTPMAATTLENALLLEQLQEQVSILTEREEQLAALSARLMRAQEEERARLALDLHDDPLQRAVLLARQAADANGQAASAEWRQEAEEIVQSLRAICAGLRPPTLDDFGLVAGIEWLLDELSGKADMLGFIRIETFDGEPFGRFDPDLELALYRIGQEALNNCIKHSGAAHVYVTARREPGDISLLIEDDGEGYEVGGLPHDTGTLHLGIMGMSERLRPWRGSVRVESAPGRGTLVIARVPRENGDGEGG